MSRAPGDTERARPFARPQVRPETPSQPDLGFPGSFPYTRGVQPTMYRGRLWTMRQYAGFGTAPEANRRYRYLLSQGVTGLSVAFDLPTQMGYDSDHPLAAGEVGRVGVAIASLRDMVELFDSVPLDRVSTSMTINATAVILLALYVAAARRQGLGPAALTGTVQNDILKEYIARGTHIFPPRASMRIVTDVFAYCEREMPQWNTISVSGYHIREAGATAAQELAFTIANGIAYLQAAAEAGLHTGRIARRMSFFFNCHRDFLEEIAKFRAARRLWARTVRDRFGIADPRAQQLRCHVQTAGSTLTAQQPDNNIVRVALQALAAVLGGTQSLHCNGRDEALSLPTEDAARLALRTQQIIAAETGVANTIDPAGGAYAIEEITNRLESEAAAILERIDALGGTLTAIEAGWIQRQIEDAAYVTQRRIDAGEISVVGVNLFADAAPGPAPLEQTRSGTFGIDPDVERRQIARLQQLRSGRDPQAWADAMERVTGAARSGENLVPPVLRAVESDATVGEISDALRSVFGEYAENASPV
jgi:methylmalonyl-CoA mutase N-terminal domain/subunit